MRSTAWSQVTVGQQATPKFNYGAGLDWPLRFSLDGLPPLGIGRNCVIERAIIDKNARIGDGVVITPEGKTGDADGPNWYVRDGIVIIPKNAVIPAGGWI